MTWAFADSRPHTPLPAVEYASDEGPMTAEEIVGLEEELSYGRPSPVIASPVSTTASHTTDFIPNGPIINSSCAHPSPSTRFWFSDGSVVIKESTARQFDFLCLVFAFLVTLQVNATLYKVHKSIMMQKSCFFQEELTARTLPPSPPKLKKGKKVIQPLQVGLLGNPLVLHNVTNSGFELVLSFIYPMWV